MGFLLKIVAVSYFLVGISTAFDFYLDGFGLGESTDSKSTSTNDQVPCNLETTLDIISENLHWQTPNYGSGNYNNDSHCTWTISAPDGYQVKFTITEGISESCCDYVEVFSSSSTDGDDIGKVGGSVTDSTQRQFISHEGVLTILFSSDDSVTDRGFEGNFQLLSAGEIPEYSNTFETSAFDIDETTITVAAPTESTVVDEQDLDFDVVAKDLFSEECSITYNVVGEEQIYFNTPGFPSPGYPDDIECTYTFIAPAGRKVKVNFVNGETEECCDKVKVTSDTILLDTLGGVLTGKNIISPDDSLKLILHTDSSVSKAGFNATYQLLPESEKTSTSQSQSVLLPKSNALPTNQSCGLEVVADNNYRSLRTPGFPYSNYQNYENCSWTVRAPEGKKIEITVESGITEECCDFLKVTDKKDETDMAQFSGNADPDKKVITISNSVQLIFTSDDTLTMEGYRVSYKAVDGSVESTSIRYGMDKTTQFASTASPSAESEVVTDSNTAVQAPEFPFSLHNMIFAAVDRFDVQPNTDESNVGTVAKGQSSSDTCGYTSFLTSSWQNISTPNWPNNYPNNARCEWRFSVSEPNLVEMIIHRGNTEDCCDYIEVAQFDSNMENSVSLGRKAGSVTEAETIQLKVKEGYFVVNFISDSSLALNGYSISVRATPLEEEIEEEDETEERTLFWESLAAGVRSGIPFVNLNERAPPFMDTTDMALFPGCTALEYINDFTSCASLFVNQFPYQQLHECSINSKMFMNCLKQKTDLCRTGTKLTIFDTLVAMGYAPAATELKRAILGFANSNMVEQLCDETWSRDTIVELHQYHSPLVLSIGRFVNSSSDVESLRNIILDFLNVQTSKKFCRLYEEAFQRIQNINFITNNIPDIWTSLVINFLKLIFPVYPQNVIPSNFVLPKCLAYKEISETTPSGCLQKELDITFVVQGSGYTSNDEFDEAMSFISGVLDPYPINQLRLGFTLYSKYEKKTSMKNQAYIKTEVPSQYFNSHLNFRELLINIEKHELSGEEAYVGRALKKALLFSGNSTSTSNQICTQKIIFIVIKNRVSDLALFRNLAPRLKQEGKYVFVVGVGDADKRELEGIITSDIGKVIYSPSVSDLPQHFAEVKDQMDALFVRSMMN